VKASVVKNIVNRNIDATRPLIEKMQLGLCIVRHVIGMYSHASSHEDD
jgi:hypothetical protein